MKQILQNLRTGQTVLSELPTPTIEPGHLLIRTKVSLVSPGTEKMLVQFGKASLFEKARSQPDKVRQVVQKIRSDGLMPTIDAVFRRLDEPMPLGYSNAGVVVGIGEGVTGFSLGDRVASNGPHAEFVSVPANLAAVVPGGVSDVAAAFTVLGAIGLQGIRLARPEIGETFVVIGLGLIGQLAVQLLKANGCRVIGLDVDPAKVEIARGLGIEAVNSGGELDSAKWIRAQTGGSGADGVIVTAATPSHDVIAQSAHMSRKRGRIILVGVVGLNLNRADFYEKELTFQVSCSYGPGRYDDAYEEKGYDYPPAFVRWTENRNFQAVLQALSAGAVKVESLVTQRVPLANFHEIYDDLESGALASLILYPELPPDPAHAALGAAQPGATLRLNERKFSPSDGVLAIAGAGNFAKMTALPALQKSNAKLKAIVSASGVTGTSLARRYQIPVSSTDYAAILRDPEIKGVIITTRHNLHAGQVIAALQARKHVLVEKPLCLTLDELLAIEAVQGELASRPSGAPAPNRESTPPILPTLTVGFNRRFAPHAETMRGLLADAPGPISMVATMNAGAIPPGHWVHDPSVGGGRILGEACHLVDFAIFLTGSLIVEVSAAAMAGTTDSASILLRHANGSTSVVNYFAHGHRAMSKERIEVYSQGRTLLLDNFSNLHGHGFRSFSKLKTRQDKGHERQYRLFSDRVQSGGAPLIPWVELANGMRATLAALRAIESRTVVPVLT